MSSTQDNTYNALSGKEAMEEVKQETKQTVEEVKEKAEATTEEAKGLLASMVSTVSSAVSSVVDSASALTSKVIDAAVGAKEVAVEKTNETIHAHPVVEGYVDATKEKAAQLAAAGNDLLATVHDKGAELTEQYASGLIQTTKDKAAQVTAASEKAFEASKPYIAAGMEKADAMYAAGSQKAGELYTAGSEKAGEMYVAGKEKAQETLHNHPVVESYVNAGIEKASAAVATAGDYVPVLKAKAGEVAEQATEKAQELKEKVIEKKEETKEKVAEKKEEVKEKVVEKKEELKTDAEVLLEKTHGDEVDHTGHIVVAPEGKVGKESDYVGGWETVEKGGKHHAAEPTKNAAPAK